MLFDFSKWQEVAKAQGKFVSEQELSGEVNLTEYSLDTQTLVLVEVDVRADPTILTPGLHGCHIHETGLAEPPFASAKGHFDAGPFGNPDPDANHPFHSGDLPNLNVDESGHGFLETVTNRVTLSHGPISIFDEDGASMVIHTHTDHCEPAESKSGHSGGPRLACAVIEKV